MTIDRHALQIKGYNELLAEFCELGDRVTAIEAIVAQLRLPELVDELTALGCTVNVSIEKERPAEEIVADLGHGWRIIRITRS